MVVSALLLGDWTSRFRDTHVLGLTRLVMRQFSVGKKTHSLAFPWTRFSDLSTVILRILPQQNSALLSNVRLLVC